MNISISDDKVSLEDTEILVFQLASTDVPVGDPAVTSVQIHDDDSEFYHYSKDCLKTVSNAANATMSYTHVSSINVNTGMSIGFTIPLILVEESRQEFGVLRKQKSYLCCPSSSDYCCTSYLSYSW